MHVGYRGRARLVDKSGQTIPSRLGLQAPFRLLGDEDCSRDLQRHDRHHTKKRRISISSDTTYLQPATAPGKAESESDNRNSSRRHHPGLCLINIDDNDSASSTISSSSYSVTDYLPKKPAKTYERRPRHKTRGDRYEKKQKKERAKAKAKNAAKTGEKRKRKAKPGVIPTHNFMAKNVTQDRLTVRYSLIMLWGCKRGPCRSWCVSDIQSPTVDASTEGWSLQERPRFIPGEEERM